jgi:hypothetical protein
MGRVRLPLAPRLALFHQFRQPQSIQSWGLGAGGQGVWGRFGVWGRLGVWDGRGRLGGAGFDFLEGHEGAVEDALDCVDAALETVEVLAFAIIGLDDL